MPDDPGAPPPPLLAGEGLSERGDGVPLTLENTDKKLSRVSPTDMYVCWKVCKSAWLLHTFQTDLVASNSCVLDIV